MATVLPWKALPARQRRPRQVKRLWATGRVAGPSGEWGGGGMRSCGRGLGGGGGGEWRGLFPRGASHTVNGVQGWSQSLPQGEPLSVSIAQGSPARRKVGTSDLLTVA